MGGAVQSVMKLHSVAGGGATGRHGDAGAGPPLTISAEASSYSCNLSPLLISHARVGVDEGLQPFY